MRLRGRAFDLAIMVTWFARAPGRAVVAWYALDTPQRARDETTSRIAEPDIYLSPDLDNFPRLTCRHAELPGLLGLP